MPAAVHALGVLWMEPAAVLCAGSASCQLLVTSRHAAACTHLLARQLLTTPLPPCCCRRAATCACCRRMLVKESGQRVTMPEIMAHPWFQRNMPAGLLGINSRVDPSKARQVGKI